MSDEYYVIVDLENLTFMTNGESTNLKGADKFNTLEEIENELKTYDDDFNGAIYKVKEVKEIKIKKVY